MAGPRGKAHGGRTAKFPADQPVRAAAVLHPDEEAFAAFRWLLDDMDGASAAEVVRQGLITLYHQRKPQRGHTDQEKTAEAA